MASLRRLRRLAVRKRIYLSKGGRITLIKCNFLTFLHIFYHYFLCLQVWHIELRRFFVLWGVIGEEARFHLFSWDQVCSPILYVEGSRSESKVEDF